jgi:Ras-related protein Rab-28
VYKQTIGIEFYEKSLTIRGDQKVSLRLWDVGGQSIHSKNLDKYLANSHVVFLVYDVTNVESFNNMDDWLRKVRNFGKVGQHLYLVGNKIDLYDLRQVTKVQHDRYVFENNLNGGLLLSARTGENVVRTFYQVAADLIGVSLSAYELSFYDKVLKVHIDKVDDSKEGRTDFADEIEAEDLANETKKKERENTGGCHCCIA